MAAVGIEANFEEGVECRLGAYRHIVDDYRGALRALSCFVEIEQRELCGDEELVRVLPEARRHLGFPVLLLLRATKPGA